MTGNSQAPSSKFIDHATLEELKTLQEMSGNTGLLHELFSMFEPIAKESLATIAKAVSRGDTTAAADAAHGFKSSAANLGLKSIAALCQKLETAGRNAGTNSASVIATSVMLNALYTDLAKECDSAMPEIRAFTESLSSSRAS